MNKVKANILANVRPGDILLHRRKKDPLRQKTPDGIFGYWRHAFLYLGNNRVLACAEGMCFKAVLPMFIDVKNNDYAIFRLRDELEKEQFEKIVEAILDVLKLEYNGFHFTFSQEELIAIGYKKIGINFSDNPEWKTTPLDFDKSLATVRVL